MSALPKRTLCNGYERGSDHFLLSFALEDMIDNSAGGAKANAVAMVERTNERASNVRI